jgi:guanylate kinase
LLEIDWQGARQVKRLFTQTIGIFILPPSIQTLEQRLQQRGQDSQEVIQRRIEAASEEISHAPECEYVIINQDFRIALSELAEVVAVARLRYGSQSARNKTLFTSLGLTI